VWFALVIRKMLIIITAIFAPLAFAGGVADLSRGWVRKWLEAMLALVFSKLILIIIFIIGLGVLGGMGSPSGDTPLSAITEEITGLLILLVAGFSPWMALRIVHFTGDHVATMAGSASHASAGASTVVGAPQKVAQMKYSAMMLSGGRSGSVAPPPDSGLGPLAGGNASARAGASAGAAAGAATGGATLVASAGVEAGKRVHAAATRGAEHGTATEKPAGSGARASGGVPRRNDGTGQSPGRQSSTPSPAASDSSASRPTPSPTPRGADADAPQTPLAQQHAPHSSTTPASSAPTSPSVPPPPFPVSPPESRKQ
jgi:type IV secretion system protein TrbL